MIMHSIQDKRQTKRYLCDEFFSRCSLQSLEGNLDMTAIDFSKEGMGLFTNEAIPESGNFKLCLYYENPSLSHKFKDLPCSIVHYNITEVGSQCGICFKLDQLSQDDRAALEAVELCLAKLDDPDDRYHLFGDN